MTPHRLLVVGTLVALAAVLLALLGAAVQGPRPPACGGLWPPAECRDAAYWGGLALKGLALPVGVYGGVLVAIGLGRRAAEEDEQAEPPDAGGTERPEVGSRSGAALPPRE